MGRGRTGRGAITGGDDHTVRLWDPRTRTPVAGPLTGHADWVRSVASSADGTLLATASGDGTARLYEREAPRDAGPCC
ncbi:MULTISPECIES: WD40 repeat domain-containing protein [Streptomyces]|uniref:WD40 repeat domain-containing protein n=1 Tax=Streptomyces TaxID=1883 RepID=UPI0015F977A3|nr:hypothetical protein [Streptomyces sp. GMR22]MBA6440537.1 hypothetical protein [Streptomyces sp. GMR22]